MGSEKVIEGVWILAGASLFISGVLAMGKLALSFLSALKEFRTSPVTHDYAGARERANNEILMSLATSIAGILEVQRELKQLHKDTILKVEHGTEQILNRINDKRFGG